MRVRLQYRAARGIIAPPASTSTILHKNLVIIGSQRGPLRDSLPKFSAIPHFLLLDHRLLVVDYYSAVHYVESLL